MIHDMTIPERIVSQDKTTRSQNTHHHLVGLPVSALVTIDERHIEQDAEFGRLRQRITDEERDLVCHRRALYPRTSKILHLVINLKGVEMTIALKTFRHGNGAISTESTNLQDILRTDHPYKHLQQPSLQMTACHPTMDGVDVRRPKESVEIITLRVDMLQDILVNRHFTANSPSTASR